MTYQQWLERNLTKQDWDEALRLFYDPKFGGMLKSQSSDDKTSEAWYLWRGLSHYKGNEYNLEEFLISTDRKSPIEYLPEIEEIKTVLPAQADGDGRMPDYYFPSHEKRLGIYRYQGRIGRRFPRALDKTHREPGF